MILLAVITSAHGIQGAVKVKTFTQSPENALAYGALHDEKGQEYSLKMIKLISPDGFVATVEGVTNRNQAEELRGTHLYVERHQLPAPPEEEFYHTDLIGLKVQDLTGQDIGRVRAVFNFGAGDFLEIISAAHQVYTIVFTRAAVPSVCLPKEGEEGKVQIDPQFLLGEDR